MKVIEQSMAALASLAEASDHNFQTQSKVRGEFLHCKVRGEFF